MKEKQPVETQQVTIRGVPVSDYEDIVAESKRWRGRSINTQLILAMEAYAFQLRSKERRRKNRGRNSQPKEETHQCKKL